MNVVNVSSFFKLYNKTDEERKVQEVQENIKKQIIKDIMTELNNPSRKKNEESQRINDYRI